MIKSRMAFSFSLSVLERTRASQLINAHKDELIMPYDRVFLIKRAAILLLAAAALFTLLLLITLSITRSPDTAFMERMRHSSMMLLGLFCTGGLLLKIYELLINKIMASREPQEQEDDETQHKVKLNRYFIEHITRVASGKTYWENIKESYRKGGFIFIHLRSNQCVVIPERIFASPDEAAQTYDFIAAQIARHRQRLMTP